jgi:uncharacterized protein YoxC
MQSTATGAVTPVWEGGPMGLFDKVKQLADDTKGKLDRAVDDAQGEVEDAQGVAADVQDAPASAVDAATAKAKNARETAEAHEACSSARVEAG